MLIEVRELQGKVSRVVPLERRGIGWVLEGGEHAQLSESAWFAHRDRAGQLTGIEMRRPAWRGFRPGRAKTLFRRPGCVPSAADAGRPTRVCVTEAANEAMSLAGLEGLQTGTRYLAVHSKMRGSANIAKVVPALVRAKGAMENPWRNRIGRWATNLYILSNRPTRIAVEWAA